MSVREAIHSVDWSKLEAADCAGFIVGLDLERLLDPSPQARGQTMRSLEAALVSDDRQLFSATAAAIPLMIDLAADPATPDRHAVLLLAVDAMTAGQGRQLFGGFDLRNAERARRYAASPAKDAYEGTRQKRDVLVRLLDDDDPRVRAAAVVGVAVLFDDAAAVEPALLRRIRVETDPVVQACALFGLAHAVRHQSAARVGAALQPLTGACLDAFARSALATAKLLGKPAEVPDIGAEAYVPFMTPGSVSPILFPFYDGNVVALGRDLLDDAFGAAGKKIAAAALERAAGSRNAGVLEELVDVVFGREIVKTPSELTDEQRALLLRLADVDARAFATVGLPSRASDRNRWLGLEPPGPLERLVTSGGETLPLSRVIADLQSRRKGEEILAVLRGALGDDPVAVLEVIGAMWLGVADLRTPDVDASVEAFTSAGEEALPFAEDWVEHLLVRKAENPRGRSAPVFANLVLRTLVRHGAKAGVLAPRFFPLVSPVEPREVTRELLEAMPLEARESLLLDELLPQWKKPTTSISMVVARVVPYIDLAPTPALLDRLMAVTDRSHLAPIRDEYEAEYAREIVTGALGPLAAEHPEVAAALQR